MSANRLRVREVVKTVELEPIQLPAEGGGDLHLRVEIIKEHASRYFSRIWKLEFYRVQPSFPQKRGKPRLGPADEQVLVPFDTVVGTVNGASAAKVLRKILKMIQRRFIPDTADSSAHR